MQVRTWSALACAAAALFAATPAAAQEKLTVWWGKGFYKAEDDALYAAIKKFEAKYPKVKIELSLYAPQEMIPKTVAALDAGNPPDVAYGDVYDFQVTAKWAYDGKLEDVSSIIDPMRAKFEPRRCRPPSSTTTRRRAGRTTPTRSSSRPCTSSTGRTCSPTRASRKATSRRTGRATGSFWCDKVQAGLPPEDRPAAASAPASPMGVDSSDSFYSFLTFMDAYNVKLVNDSGKLLVDDPAVRQGLINAVTDYTAVYGKGCTPPSSTSWKDPDNNVAFHNKTIVLTHNATISIAAKWLDDMNNAR